MSPSSSRLSGALLTLLEESESAPIALSTRVYRAIRGAILDRTLRAGDRLPSTRVLAADLAISRATAETAYAQLEAEGYVARRVGDGSYVNAVVPRRNAGKPTANAVPANSLSERGRRIASLGSCIDPRQVRAFSAGLPALDAFPLDVWQRLLARHARSPEASWPMYTDPQGEPVLREAIAQYLALSRGVDCDADQVIVLTSSQQALVLIAMLTLDGGDAAWIEEPGYRGAQTAFAAQGARLVPVPVDANGMLVEHGLRAAPQAKLAYVTPSHQYPLGMAMSLERRMQLLDWARRTDAWIVEDDYDSEFHYDSRPIAAIHGLDRHGRVLYVGTFSKVMYPGLRLAYLVVPKPLAPAFVAARSHLDGHSPALMQLVLADFMQNGHFMAHVRRMRELYRARRDIFLEEVERRLPGRLQPLPAAGGLQAACLLGDARASDGKLAARAGEAGIDLPILSRLYFGDRKRNGFVMGYSALPPAAIRAGVKKLAALL
ncbi:MAG TPA: PLP-dependent aminotransferase family protein [Paucimonas sp.]|nr:PLP-dependent aminotransferase family protein [Paucimonas sp.]